jgi:hypothetical protein
MATLKRSLRHIASELDISPAYLSYMLNGKRPWREDLYQRYVGVVNTFVNTKGESVNDKSLDTDFTGTEIGAGGGIRTPGFLLGKQTLYH